jgi:hypothetical protein
MRRPFLAKSTATARPAIGATVRISAPPAIAEGVSDAPRSGRKAMSTAKAIGGFARDRTS